MALLLLFLSIIFFPSLVLAGINLPWSTTYNCAEWLTYDATLSCDGLSKAGGWTVSTGEYEQIVTAANNPGGGGGRGQRHWIGLANGGTNDNSGGIDIDFNTPQTEFWFRGYIRWESGFTSDWSTYKTLYIYPPSGGGSVFHFGTPGIGGVNLYSSRAHYNCSDCGYGSAFYTSGTSDGSWQLFEVHLNVSTGVFQAWVNEQLVVNRSDVDYGSITSVGSIRVGSNLKYNTSNPGTMYIDYDDLAINNTGYIGPVAGGSETIRSNGSPTSTLSSGTTQVNMTLNTSDSSTCKYGTTPGTAYASISNTFTTTGGTSHSETLTGLSDGTSTTYYIRCDNGSAANTTDYEITVAVAESSPDPQPPTPGSTLLIEGFGDNDFESRGWYDGVNSTGVTTGGQSGNALKFTWATGNTKPTGFTTIRYVIGYPVTELYARWYEKYDTGWQGSGSTSHPHIFYFMSEDDWIYQGPATSNSTFYLESTVDTGVIYGRIAHQDELRTNSSLGTPPLDLSATTENRSSNHCNQPYTSTGAELGACYQDSNGWYSANVWNDKAVPIPANQWVLREVHIKMNTFTTGVANYDGIIRTWVNGQLDINETGVILAAGSFEGKGHSQFVIGPYMGAGSPIDQSMWIDSLELYAVGSANNVCYKDEDADGIGTGVSEIATNCSANYYLDEWFTWLNGDCDDTNASVGLCLNTKIRSGTTTLKAGTTPIRLQ